MRGIGSQGADVGLRQQNIRVQTPSSRGHASTVGAGLLAMTSVRTPHDSRASSPASRLLQVLQRVLNRYRLGDCPGLWRGASRFIPLVGTKPSLYSSPSIKDE